MSGSHAFPIVGIGASAGGIEALEGFFRGLPDRPGFAIVVVTHLSPERESRLHEVLARYTSLQVQIVTDDQPVEPNQVYVLPAAALLGIEQGRLQITRLMAGRRERKPIDIFFGALAVDQGEHAAGVVLSGGDGDGTLGVKAIKERGGLTMAQVADGHGPAYPDMPDSAIASGLIDLALPVEQMGARLVEFARGLPLLDGVAAATGRSEEAQDLDEARPEIYAILRSQVGHDFSGYKPRTFLRRVQRRMQVAQVDTVQGYIEMLRQEPQEVNALFRDLLISVTNFFRDAEAFEALATMVLPRLFDGRGADEVVRVWVPGCATGEEVFSLGMLLREQMDGLSTVPRVQIFATDIDERALGIARMARYPATLLDSVSPQRRERFFIPDGTSYVVAKEVRDLCVFSPHSVLRAPPFSRIDLVSCRNLLIYFGSEAQNQVIPIFHYALRPKGYLFLGTSENISGFGDLFAPLEKKHRIFRRRGDATQAVRLPMALAALRPGHVGETAMRRTVGNGIALRQTVETQVLERFAPPFVVVNRDGDIAYYSARTGKYLEAAPGVPTRQVLTMARKGLRLDLRTTLREAVETGRTATRAGVAVEEEDGRIQMLTLTVEPLQDRDRGEPLFLVLFADDGPSLGREEALARSQAAQDGAALRLEAELRETRERLQSLIEEYETALEEVKASNEELVSLNEELQSTNEELEASKEELQSVNEELQTVNLELNTKVEALDRANDDLQNLFESTDVATIFLDRRLQIRSFTPAATRIFNLLPTDRGRPITDLSSRFALPDLGSDIAAVFDSGEPFERRLDHEEARAHYLVRLAPYRNGDRRVCGVVLTFVDVAGLTQAEAQQRVLIAELQHRTRNLLNVVQAIVMQTLGKSGTPKTLTDRLGALGRVQSLVGQSKGRDVDLAEIVRLELRAYAAGEDGRVKVTGPPVALSYDRVQILALALHELTTNAVKYGALKGEAGRLRIAWQIEQQADGEPLLVLDWRESGVVMPPNISRRGYGRELIERALRYTTQAETWFDCGQDGVVCRIQMPLGMQAPPGD
ncbi:CheR family methyltransferase [Roseicella sp. DB1501]|uniref:CheR family methyltransferase n=1 Tax=Roseicella sp. DB1501 TaxID=2730925 RepID=UPI0014908BAF|nr:CheR family methyltransferase [Roseicella sp. DB1501]NOG72032.1 PAS domain-containing protein [Roseicella sp. DB1501]